jgi:hypothetical protein
MIPKDPIPYKRSPVTRLHELLPDMSEESLEDQIDPGDIRRMDYLWMLMMRGDVEMLRGELKPTAA